MTSPKKSTYVPLIERWAMDDWEGVIVDESKGEGEPFDLSWEATVAARKAAHPEWNEGDPWLWWDEDD